jgi:hypothetical protein
MANNNNDIFLACSLSWIYLLLHHIKANKEEKQRRNA